MKILYDLINGVELSCVGVSHSLLINLCSFVNLLNDRKFDSAFRSRERLRGKFEILSDMHIISFDDYFEISEFLVAFYFFKKYGKIDCYHVEHRKY